MYMRMFFNRVRWPWAVTDGCLAWTIGDEVADEETIRSGAVKTYVLCRKLHSDVPVCYNEYEDLNRADGDFALSFLPNQEDSLRSLYFLFLFPLISTLCVSGPIVEDGAELEKIKGGFEFTEGPAYDGKKRVLFTDIPANRIYQFHYGSGTVSVFREDTGGANGLMFDQQGRLVMCQGRKRQVTRLEPDGSVTVLADRWNGTKLNSPNDLVIRENGGIFFTDPRYGNRSSMEMDVEGVYYLPAGSDGLRRVIDDLTRPNGLMLSRDGNTLYVADPGEGQTWAYDVASDGSLSDKRLFTDTGSDGMTIDDQGNVYLTTENVEVFSPDGERIDTIEVPENTSNITFGPPDGGTLYITARTGFYRVETIVQQGR